MVSENGIQFMKNSNTTTSTMWINSIVPHSGFLSNDNSLYTNIQQSTPTPTVVRQSVEADLLQI